MPIIFDVLYREFCRARLAEMRKQLLLRPSTPVVPEENCEADPRWKNPRPDLGFTEFIGRLGYPD